ncbi:GDSL esterase/lipase WDL1-like [Prosopis cineraria]|uniref:GDSL esterase/lipase WDL1-like n=1 Tax=Prosopis cineraria TaxID=364024 RepID=UPI0024100E75|nr:GDSL esterase/lipase WDL1-like [Prosopis cineraria]
MVGPVRPEFVLFGSSIVELSFNNQGWGSILAHLYSRRADIVLRGYSGWNSRRALEVLSQVFPKEGGVQPAMIIVYFGGNDSMLPHPSGLGPHVPLDEYIHNMRTIALHLQSLSEKTRLIFLTSPPINEAQIQKSLSGVLGLTRTNESCRRYSEACLKLCQEMNIKAIDLWNALQQRDDWLDVCFTDGIHLSSVGSKIVAKEIMRVLKEAEWEPSLHWKSMPMEFSQPSPYDPVSADGKTTINVSSLTLPAFVEWE